MEKSETDVFLRRTQYLMCLICFLIITLNFFGLVSNLNSFAVILGCAVAVVNLILIWRVSSAITNPAGSKHSPLLLIAMIKLPILLGLLFVASNYGSAVLNGAALGFMCFVPALILSGLSLGLRD